MSGVDSTFKSEAREVRRLEVINGALGRRRGASFRGFIRLNAAAAFAKKCMLHLQFVHGGEGLLPAPSPEIVRCDKDRSHPEQEQTMEGFVARFQSR